MDKATLHTCIRSFLAEDIGRGDLTSESIFDKGEVGRARIVARESFVVAGGDSVAAEVFLVQNPAIVVEGLVTDGVRVGEGDILFTVSGPVVDLLKAERVALNLLQRLSGIATFTAQFVEQVQSCPVRITDTRKTTPGLRMLEKYAVQVGGGYNHRFNLADGILVKDNHIAACGSITKAVALLRRKIPHTLRIEVETDTLDQVRECLACGVDIIMLDNMDAAMMQEAVRFIDHRALVEASGGVTLESVLAVARSGVDIVSIGALTHSAPSCDIGMDWIP
ncbi:MAG: carboxylating nicotinate-nucleotide diphosphorylase [Proteobacteria bacterium]|nr:carboxylating nicotinate-nucleotide diphosphorylase [Desulfocapsa sp.]MBU3943871.1 carboxylating nicotinate-nucleotide diphosphorylase [Pseudomonadota bacterium]MCG2742966.1 carboxylating nicotinate-nucleotide diphosphorylase [Desulfobacteraceae bacterium]MBU3983741.1 carboxylating nicotinate-nucleotide diphosphorylase [Pseudomonadota bacterium]MBU4027980.1 carboxylating nicotinate-nucleotide diphosphorylase [Pseudomonadota bacterium]